MTIQENTPADSDILNRDRKMRWGVLIGTTSLVALTGYAGGYLFSNELMESDLAAQVGGLIGLAAGLILDVEILHRSVIRNTTTQSFLTIDTLASLLGKKNVHATYGPGTHIAFWWERRIPENNISLEEASQDFEFVLQCSDGTITAKGSFRLRPNMTQSIEFLTGVAAMAADLQDLIIARAVRFLGKEKVGKAVTLLEELNIVLEEEFCARNTAFEKRFGVHVGDITIKELLPSEDVQKTMNALTEAAAIKKGTALLLGMSMAEVKRKLDAKTLSYADYNHARDRFLSISGNLEGMDIKRTEFDLSVHGIEKETAEAIVLLAQQLPNINIGKKGGRK